MLKRLLLAASTTALIAIGAIAATAVTSSSATAQRGFGCQTDPSRCTNQLRTPRTFARNQNRGGRKGLRKRGNKR